MAILMRPYKLAGGPTVEWAALDFERTFNRCMGLYADGKTLYMSTLFQFWRFEDCLEAGHLHDGYDRLYVPRVAWTTGDIDVHDVGVDGGYGCRKHNRPLPFRRNAEGVF